MTTITDLAVPDSSDLVVHRPPEVVLAEAQRAALALKGVLDAKPKPVIFNGETYLEHEDWLTVGRFYGISPRVTVTRFVQFGDVIGWEATADAVHVASAHIVSSAEAMCLNDEEKWRSRPKYEWHYVRKSDGLLVAEDPGKDELVWEEGSDGKRRPKKERVQVGAEAVPLFQLRSMAQTRACAKAMRIALGWVVTLAGYRATPAEELPDHGRDEARSGGGVNHGAANTARPPRADGSALVKDVAEKSANGKTYYVVRFDTELSTGDGQTANQGSTFDAAMAKAARAAKDAGAFVVPTLTRNGRYVNLTGLKDAVGPEGEPEDDGPLSDEQAERIVKTAEGMGWSAADLETLCAKYGAEHPAALPAVKYQEILTALKQGPKALA